MKDCWTLQDAACYLPALPRLRSIMPQSRFIAAVDPVISRARLASEGLAVRLATAGFVRKIIVAASK